MRGEGPAPGAGERRPGALAPVLCRLAEANIASLAEPGEMLGQDGVAHLHDVADGRKFRFLHGGEERRDLQPHRGVERRVESNHRCAFPARSAR